MVVGTLRVDRAWPVFGDCPRLVALEIPASVTLIEQGALGRCESLQSLTVAAGNAVYRSEGNCIIRRADDALVSCGGADTIPASVRILLPYSIYGTICTSLRIPSGVEEIEGMAIFDCAFLEQVYVPRGASYATEMLYVCPLATIVPYDPEAEA